MPAAPSNQEEQEEINFCKVSKKDVIVFKAQRGDKVNWLSNFYDCNIKMLGSKDPVTNKRKEWNFPSVEHAFQAYTKVKHTDWKHFEIGGIFADWDKFYEQCNRMGVKMENKPKHGLIGWIAKKVVTPERLKKFHITPREKQNDINDSLTRLEKFLEKKFSDANPDLRDKLMETIGKILIEAADNRSNTKPNWQELPNTDARPPIWDAHIYYDESEEDGRNAKYIIGVFGKNYLGKSIMHVRDKIIWPNNKEKVTLLVEDN
jgi:predicted NAD-dependent protein-ADP-ribosyltransferase YbiA (DUF1768 family)